MKQSTGQTIKQLILTAIFSFCIALFLTTTANAATYTITTTADSGAGSLRQAILDANASAGVDDTINFAISAGDASCSNGTCTITLSSGLPQIVNAGKLVIDNSAGANKIVVSGNNMFQPLYLQSGANLTLTAIAITNGRSTDRGGAVNSSGTLTLNNSIISNNTATNYGAGIFNNGGTMTLNNSTVSGNTTGSDGGGVFNNNGTMTLNNSTVSGNTGTYNGGIFGNGGTLTLNNSTVSGNSGLYSGGIVSYGTLKLNDSTVAFNSSTDNGVNCGGLCAGGISIRFGTVTLTNTIVAKNTAADAASAPDINGAIVSTSSYNLIGNNTKTTGIANGTNGNQIGTSAAPIDPLLAALADNGGLTQTLLPQANSPVVDKGNSAATTDQRGFIRPYDNPSIANATGGNGADIGATEVQLVYVVDTTSDASLTACTAAAGDCSLRGAITNANASAGVNDTINFNIAGCANSICTITLGSALPDIANAGKLTIDNSTGTNKVVVSGNNQFQVFKVGAGANLTLTAVTVTGGLNNFGGGIYNSGGTLTLNNSTVSGNSAAGGDGGGIRNDSNSALTLNNSTVSGNSGLYSGGIANFAGTVTLNNSTVAFNAATGAGGCTGDCPGGVYSNGGTVTLTNTIVAKNTAADAASGSDFYGAMASTSSYNLIGSGTGMSGISDGANGNQVGTGASPIDPLLAALTDNGGKAATHLPQTGSPAIDKGNSTATADQRGMSRPVDNSSIANATGGNGSDIGAVEVALAPTAANVAVAGRVVTPEGRGLMNATVFLTDASGATRAVRTTTFGYFSFDEIAAGQTVIVSIDSKRYQFAPQILSVSEDLTEVVLQAQLLRAERNLVPALRSSSKP